MKTDTNDNRFGLKGKITSMRGSFINGTKRKLIDMFEVIRSRPILKDIVTTTFFTIVGRSLGLVVPIFIAAWYGVGGDTDAFFFSYSAIFFLAVIFSTSVEAVVVPFIAEIRTRQGDLGKFVGSLLVGFGLTILAAGLLLAAGGYHLFRLITGFSGPQLTLAYVLSLETFPIIFLGVWSSVLTGVLNAHHAYAHPQLSYAARAVAILAAIFALKGFLGIHAIPAGYVLGEGARAIYLFAMFAYQKLAPLKFTLPTRETLEFFTTAGVRVAAAVAFAFNPVVDKIMASWLETGSVSLLEYGEKLFFVPLNLFGQGLFVVLLSHWSDQIYGSQGTRLMGDLKKTVLRALWLTIPIGLVLFFLRHEIVQLAYGWGAIRQTSMMELGQIVGMYMLGFPFCLAGHIIGRGLLVLKDTVSLFKVSVINIFIKVGSNILFIFFIGLPGIALSTSLVYICSSWFLWFYFKRSFNRMVINN